MAQPALTLTATDAALVARFAAVRQEYAVAAPFPADVLAEASRAAAAPDLGQRRDATEVAFLTLDPPGSMDLDQALHIERAGAGFRVRYAIADLTAFMAPGGALDTEARRRGQTIYCPDERIPLHPGVLSEGAVSLLPGQVRPAVLWDLTLDATGEVTSVHVERALVRSRDRLDYPGVQGALDAGVADERLTLLREVGRLRMAREIRVGGAHLPLPEQVVERDDEGRYAVHFRPPLPAEDWNAQISLMTGVTAAALMSRAGVGVVRTMPPADAAAVDRFRRQATALGVPWAPEVTYGAFLAGLDRDDPRQLALIYEAGGLFRGAGYAVLGGGSDALPLHAALGSTYAHVTAPLRRLVDRFGLEVCLAICAGEDPPTWVEEALPTLPGLMAGSDRTARAVSRACVDAAEAAVLSARVGQHFPAVVVESGRRGLTVQVLEPAVVAGASGSARVGENVTVRLAEAEVATSTVRFAVEGEPEGR